ncbi:MAG: hydantoinase B/oxoprolinase family protein [Gammaproteobacteria bacterium]|nr:hydantoinase B/oxoprolinase family protein [Gammaproteobacteria bacterium]
MNNIDPITTEIIRNAFIAIANDMNAALIRSAFTPIIYEGKDCSVALLDAEGNVLGQSLGLPLFLRNREICVRLIALRHGCDYFSEGYVFYMNDSYMTGTHLNDSTIITPIFWQGERIGFAASRAHWLDVGAKDPGSPVDSSEIYQEGMRWGPTRLYRDGEPREDVIDVLRRNSRFGDALIGDLNAQIAAGRTGEQRLKDLYRRFGKEAVLAARDVIFRQTEERERQAIRGIADGRYEAEGWLDNDGLDDEPVPVKVAVIVREDTMAIDLTGSGAQTRGPVNCGFTQTVAAGRVAFKLLVCSDDPANGGSFRPLSVKAPENTLFNAREPAPCAWYFSSLGLLIDLVVKALAPELPEQAAGAHYGDSMVVTISGGDPRRNDERYLMVEPTTGGWGGFAGGDGADSLINNVNGNFKDLPVEIFENKYPVLIEAYGIRADSGGAGRQRGGNGTYRQYVLQADATLSLWFERSKSTAWGLFGGHAGAAPDVQVEMPDGTRNHYLKVNSLSLPAGTRVVTRTGGGGGFGLPSERSPEAVRRDVLDGFLSLSSAENAYGIAIAPT